MACRKKPVAGATSTATDPAVLQQAALRLAASLVDGADRMTLDPHDWGAEVALGCQLLAQAMQATLDGVHIAYVRGGPSANVATYLFGRLQGGPLCGRRVITVET